MRKLLSETETFKLMYTKQYHVKLIRFSEICLRNFRWRHLYSIHSLPFASEAFSSSFPPVFRSFWLLRILFLTHSTNEYNRCIVAFVYSPWLSGRIFSACLVANRRSWIRLNLTVLLFCMIEGMCSWCWGLRRGFAFGCEWCWWW